jgi:hypothetical protein
MTFFLWARTALPVVEFVFLSGSCRPRLLAYLVPQYYRRSRPLPASPVIKKSRTTTTPLLVAIRCSQLPSLTLPVHSTMHKFNLIVLSLLFILSVTAAAPVNPEQAVVKRGCEDSQDCGSVWLLRSGPRQVLTLFTLIALNQPNP